MKTMTLRLDDRRAELVERIATDRALSRADVIRLAIDRLETAPSANAELRDDQVERLRAHYREGLDLLADR